jgi:hypothetical protein
MLAVFLAVAIFAGAASVQADHLVRQIKHNDEANMMGRMVPARTDTVDIWLGDKVARTSVGDTMSILVDMEKNNVAMLIDHNKTYFMTDFAEMAAIVDDFPRLAALMDEEIIASDSTGMAVQIKQLFESFMNVKTDIQPTDETMELHGWKCKRYNTTLDMGMMKISQVIWASTDVGIDQEKYLRMAYAEFLDKPFFQKLIEDFKAIEGVIVKSENTMSMFNSKVVNSTEIIEVAEKDAPAGTFAVPEGYTEIPSPFESVTAMFKQMLDSLETKQKEKAVEKE